jgi:mRNA-degrading endonuclease RelE of RelBE toxin-antitoxin system
MKKTTHQNTSKSPTKYEIVLSSNAIKKDWDALCEAFPDRMQECKEFLRNNPEDRSKALGKLKKLKGSREKILQYDVTKDEYRVWYKVNKRDKIVVIKYAGAHPE